MPVSVLTEVLQSHTLLNPVDDIHSLRFRLQMKKISRSTTPIPEMKTAH